MWGTKITLDRKNIRGTIVNIHVQADMTEEEFVEALRKDENLVDQP
jgi:acetoin utilization deacetylase AcuC-like enzyme